MAKKFKIVYEDNVHNVLSDDGINSVDLSNEYKLHTEISELQKLLNEDSWAKRLIYNKNFSAHLICQKPGETNRTHFHENDDEMWVVLNGKIKWWIEEAGIIYAEIGDVIFVPQGRQHKIKTIGNENSLRLAISSPDIPHYHPTIDLAPDDF